MPQWQHQQKHRADPAATNIVLQSLSGMDAIASVRDDFATSTVNADGLNKVSLEKWTGVIKDAEPDEAKFRYLQGKYK